MSYGQPPPRTPYGDQDFIKEDGPTGGPPMAGMPSRPQIPAYQYPAQGGGPYSQTSPPMANPRPLQQAPYGHQMSQQQPGQLDPKQLAAATFSLTPEDQIFMQSWRRDSFYQRVLPLTAIFNGGYFYYNYSRSLPQRSIPHLMLTVAAYAIGKWSFRDELKRRLEANPSQTPFMTSLRQVVGLQTAPLVAGGEFSGDLVQDYTTGFGSANVAALPPPTSVNPAYMSRAGGPSSSSHYAPYMQDSQTYQPYEPDLSLTNANPSANDETSRSTTSYEELRARNRGLIK